MKDKERRQLVQEVNLLREFTHPNIVRYYSRYVDKQLCFIFILMEFCEGGDLASVIQLHRQAGTHLPEEIIWSYLAQLSLALYECHHGYANKKGIMESVLHRDIKPENVFLDAKNNIKLGDFGLSTLIRGAGDRCFAQTFVGTPFYMSPELINETGYNTKSDIWALGCLIYELCNLEPPFRAHTHHQLHEKIRLGQYPKLLPMYSKPLRDVVSKLLQVSPDKRPSAEQLLQHPHLIYILREKRFLALFQEKELILKAKEDALIQNQQVLLDLEKGIQEKQTLLNHREDALNRREMELQNKESELVQRELALEHMKEKAHSIPKAYQSSHMIDFSFTEPKKPFNVPSFKYPSTSKLTFTQWMNVLPSSLHKTLDQYLSQLKLEDDFQTCEEPDKGEAWVHPMSTSTLNTSLMTSTYVSTPWNPSYHSHASFLQRKE
ncbi:G2-specific serine/threonine protein kinase [Coelomomyces lativittatus]|nr:G2-specific serine/threonine protein kinase [Coelomomyces lativittatus]